MIQHHVKMTMKNNRFSENLIHKFVIYFNRNETDFDDIRKIQKHRISYVSH